jgi:hypothetical protein
VNDGVAVGLCLVPEPEFSSSHLRRAGEPEVTGTQAPSPFTVKAAVVVYVYIGYKFVENGIFHLPHARAAGEIRMVHFVEVASVTPWPRVSPTAERFVVGPTVGESNGGIFEGGFASIVATDPKIVVKLHVVEHLVAGGVVLTSRGFETKATVPIAHISVCAHLNTSGERGMRSIETEASVVVEVIALHMAPTV